MSLSLTAMLLLSVPEMREIGPADVSPADTVMHHVPEHPLVYAQVRIEKRVIIRVPRRRPTPLAPMTDYSQDSAASSYREKKIGKCVPMNNILASRCLPTAISTC